MASRSATVLVIFVIAVFAFCLASVFASMTGPISILPNETESGGILDNLSAITNDTIETTDSNNYDYQDYSYDSSDDSSDDSSSNVETTTDDSSQDDSSIETTVDSSTSDSSKDTSKDSSSSSSGNGGGGSSNVETTTDGG